MPRVHASEYAERAVKRAVGESDSEDPAVLFEEACEAYDDITRDRRPTYDDPRFPVQEVHGFIRAHLRDRGVEA